MTNTNANNEKCKQWACASSEKGNFLLPKAGKVEQFLCQIQIQTMNNTNETMTNTNVKHDKC